MTFSIGDVLEQLSDEFPDITVSKIRFLESQGLISPMRTASGFRMFSDIDITKLKWILLHQRDRFLPLKVIKEYLSTLSDDDFANNQMPAFDFESSGALPLEGNDKNAETLEPKAVSATHLASVPDIKSNVSELKPKQEVHPAQTRTTLIQERPQELKSVARRKPSAETTRNAMRNQQAFVRDSYLNQLDINALKGTTESMSARKNKAKTSNKNMLTLEEMTSETSISGPTLKELANFGVLQATGTGNALVFNREEVELANIIQPLLERGLEPRHIKNYVLFAGREVGFLEHIIQDDLRRRNPDANEIALEKAKQFIQDTARLKEILLIKALKDES